MNINNDRNSENIIVNNNNVIDSNQKPVQEITKKLAAKLYTHRYNAEYILNQLAETNNPKVFTYASKSNLQETSRFVIRALKINPEVLQYAKYYQNDEYFINTALEEGVHPEIMKYAGSDLKKNEDTISFLAKTNIETLSYINESMKTSRTLVQKLVKSKLLFKNEKLFTYFKPEILIETTLVSYLYATAKKKEDVTIQIIYLSRINNNFDDPEFIKKLARYAGGEFDFGYLKEDIRNNPEVIRHLLQHDFQLQFDYIGSNLKENKEFALDILSDHPKNVRILKFFSEEIQQDWDVLLISFLKFPRTQEIYESLSNESPIFGELIANNTEFVKQAINMNRDIYQYLPENMQKNVEIALHFLKNAVNSEDLELIPQEVRKDARFLTNLKENSLYDQFMKKIKTDWKTAFLSSITEKQI